MVEAPHREHEVSDMFVAYLLAHIIRYEEDLVLWLDRVWIRTRISLGRQMLARKPERMQ